MRITILFSCFIWLLAGHPSAFNMNTIGARHHYSHLNPSVVTDSARARLSTIAAIYIETALVLLGCKWIGSNSFFSNIYLAELFSGSPHSHGLGRECVLHTLFTYVSLATFTSISRSGEQSAFGFSRLLSMQTKALLGHGHLELWLGRGRPLNPYLRFVLVDKVLSQLRPKDLRVTPAELFVTEKVSDFQEYSTLRGWVQQWLRYCHWYYSVAMDPQVKLDDLFDGPVYTSSWRATKRDESLVRFGLLWRLYDLVGQMGLEYRPPILSSGAPQEQSCGWLLGGAKGSDFLVRSLGLVQPRAGKGVNLDPTFLKLESRILNLSIESLRVGVEVEGKKGHLI